MTGLYCQSSACDSPRCRTLLTRGADVNVATWQGENRSHDRQGGRARRRRLGQVVAVPRAAGICGTDVHATQGLFPWKPPLVARPRVHRRRSRAWAAESAGASSVALSGCEPSYGCGACASVPGRAREPVPALRARGRLRRARGAAGRATSTLLPRGPRSRHRGDDRARPPCCLAGLEMFPDA